MNVNVQNRNELENYVEALYQRALKGQNAAIINQAKAMLISKYMAKKDYARAQELLNSLPEQDLFDKKQLQINLLTELGKLDEAAVKAEEKLLSAANEIHALLITVMEIAIKQNRTENAEYIADISKKSAEIFDLWEFNSYGAHFQLYSALKQRIKAVKVLIPMLKSLTKKWDTSESPLYRHIKTKEIEKTFGPKLQKTLVESLLNDKDTQYIKDNPEIKPLIDNLLTDNQKESAI